MIKINFKKIDAVAIICWVIATFLLTLSIYKAYRTSFTHDECISYNSYVKSSLKTSVLFLDNPTANNHILNTLLMAACNILLGNSEIALRLPNIIAHFFFLIFTFKIIKGAIENKTLVVLSYIIINLNPYMLDFFALARGYGISITFIIISIYYLFRFSESEKSRNYNLALLFALLATYSNMSSLYFFCGLVIVYNLSAIKNYKNSFAGIIKYLLLKNKFTIIYSLILVLLLGYPILTLIKNNQFYYGGENNFWSDTIKSLIYSTLYSHFYNGFGENFLKIVTVLTVLATVLVLYKKYSSNTLSRNLSIIFLLTTGIILTINIQHYTLGSKLIVGRTALFLLPIFALNFCLLIACFSNSRTMKIPALLLGFIAAGITTFHTAHSYSLTKYADWDYDRNTKKAIQILEKSNINPTAEKVNLGINWLFEPAINYYIKSDKLNWLNKVNRNGLNENQDYYYIFESDTIELKNIKYSILYRFDDTKTILAKRM